MEKKMAKLFEEQLPSIKHLTEDLFQNRSPKQDEWDSEIRKHSAPELAKEEETLRTYLDKLKKENFTLRTSIKAWQTTLETKLDEFDKANLKLEELYNEIWAEREKFCSKLEKFNEEYGILSNWWEMQIRFVSEMENPGAGTPDDEKHKQDIEKLEKEISDLKKEIEEIQTRKHETEMVASTTEGCPTSARRESKTVCGGKEVKKVKFLEADEENKVGKVGGEPANDLYSVVDLEKMKLAKRRRKNNFFRRDKNLQTPQHFSILKPLTCAAFEGSRKHP